MQVIVATWRCESCNNDIQRYHVCWNSETKLPTYALWQCRYKYCGWRGCQEPEFPHDTEQEQPPGHTILYTARGSCHTNRNGMFQGTCLTLLHKITVISEAQSLSKCKHSLIKSGSFQCGEHHFKPYTSYLLTYLLHWAESFLRS